MKVVPSMKTRVPLRPPPIPFLRPKPSTLTKEEYHRYKLRTNPAVADSAVYEQNLPLFKGGKPEETLVFLRELHKVLEGTNSTTPASKYQLTRNVLRGDALAKFNAAATINGDETEEHFNLCIRALVSHVFPTRALKYQRRYMSRMMRLSHFPNTTVREYMNRIVEMNAYLPYFPPFDGNNEHHAFTEDELLDIGEFTIPRSMQEKLMEHGFDITAEGTTIDTFVSMCERYEEAQVTNVEDMDKKPKATSSYSKRKSPSHSHSADEKWCSIHQSKTHNTEDCYEVKRLKANKSQDASKKPQFKPASRPSYGSKTDKETIHTLVEMVKRLKKASTSGKKRKKSDAEVKQMDEQFETLSVSDDEEASDDSSSSKSNESSEASEHS